MQGTWVQSLVGKIPWRRAWLPPPVFWPGESHRQRSLVGYSPWGRTESDMTKQLNTAWKNSKKIKKKMVWNNTKNWVDGCCMLNTENWVNVYTVRFQSDLWNRPSPFSLTISVIFICGFIWMGAWWWEKQRKAEKVLLLRGEPCTADAVSSAAASQICDSYSTVLGYHHPGPREGNGAGEQMNEWTRSKGSHLLSLLGACPWPPFS